MKNHLPIAVLLLLTGCPQSENNNPNPTMTCASGDKAFIGCWKTTECTQVKDGAGSPIESWFLSQYEFTPSNTLNIANYVYADSSCSGTAQEIPNSSSTLPVITYTWTQAITTANGLAGDEIAVTDTNPATATTINTNVDLVITAAGQLCTSSTLILGSGYITVSPTSTGTDFTHCLDPVIP